MIGIGAAMTAGAKTVYTFVRRARPNSVDSVWHLRHISVFLRQQVLQHCIDFSLTEYLNTSFQNKWLHSYTEIEAYYIQFCNKKSQRGRVGAGQQCSVRQQQLLATTTSIAIYLFEVMYSCSCSAFHDSIQFLLNIIISSSHENCTVAVLLSTSIAIYQIAAHIR